MVVNVTLETEKQLIALAERVGAPVAVYAGHLLEQKLHENDWQNGANGSVVVVEDDDDNDPDALAKAMAKLLNRTPEEIEQARERIFATSRPPRPLPEGKTLGDVLLGQWPGDETDEQVFEALRKLS